MELPDIWAFCEHFESIFILKVSSMFQFVSVALFAKKSSIVVHYVVSRCFALINNSTINLFVRKAFYFFYISFLLDILEMEFWGQRPLICLRNYWAWLPTHFPERLYQLILPPPSPKNSISHVNNRKQHIGITRKIN